MNYLRLIILCVLALFVFSCAEETTQPDTTPPAQITDLSVLSKAHEFSLRWTAPGDDGSKGRATKYDIRFAASNLATQWTSGVGVAAPPTPGIAGYADSLTVSGVGNGPWEFGIKTTDEAGNWSVVSNVVVASIDTIPPAAISDLSIRSTAQGFYLRWTAPGDDGGVGRATRCDIRYAASNLANGWESANGVSSPPAPGVAGQIDSAMVFGIGVGPWEFGIRTVDETGNQSELSNIVVTTIPEDITPPGPVVDLTVDLITEASVVLRWTASGDDGGTGRASAYDLRYAQAPITTGTWATATRVPGLGSPRQAGEGELFTVPGLEKGLTYYFALIVIDDTENWSPLSNVVNASVSSPVQLTFNMQYGASDPDWSPDGRSIAFQSTEQIPNGTNRPELYVLPAEGGTAVRYTTFPDGATGPSWSPDGGTFAFALSIEEGGVTRQALALMDATPGAAFQVLADPYVKSIVSAKWSPDGTSIAYVASIINLPEPPTSQVYTIPSAGGTPESLYAGWTVPGLDWSPDGTQIAYSSNESGSYDLWVMPSSGGVGTLLTNRAGIERSPSWSPDGTKIAYEGDGQIWIIYLAEQTLTQVTFDSDKSVFRGMTWSPDGTTIAYGAKKDQVSNIWVLPVK